MSAFGPSSPRPAGKRLVLALIVPLLFSVLSLLLHGFLLDGGDNDLWVPFVKAAMDPRLYPGDPFLACGQGRMSLFVFAFAPISRLVGVPWAWFLLYLLVHAAYFLVLAALLRQLLPGRSTAAVLALALLAVPRPVGGSMTTTLPALLIPRLIAEVCGIAAMLLAVRRRPVWASALLGLGVLFQPATVGPFLAALLLWWVFRARPRWKTAAAAAGALLPFVLVELVVVLATGRVGAGSSLVPDPEWMGIERLRSPELFFAEWSAAEWLRLVPPALLLVGAFLGGRRARRRGGDVLWMVGGSLLYALVVGTAGQALGVPLALQLHATRSPMVLVLLGYAMGGRVVASLADPARVLRGALAGALFVALLYGWWGWGLLLLSAASFALTRPRSGPPRIAAAFAGAASLSLVLGDVGGALGSLIAEPSRLLPLVLGAAAGALLLAARGPRTAPVAAAAAAALALAIVWQGGPGRFDLPWDPMKRSMTGVREWTRRNTPLDTRVLLWPLEARGFRPWAERTVLMEGGDGSPGLYSRSYARDARRLRAILSGVDLRDPVLPPELGMQPDLLVVPTAYGRLPHPVAYRDAHWTAYRLEDGTRRERSPTGF